jgi:multiple antibiotic resistance protein
VRAWNRILCFALLTVLLGSAGPAMAVEAEGTLSLGLSKIFTFFFLTLGPKAVIAPFARSTATLDPGGRRNVALATTGISLVSIVIAATLGVRVLSNWGISTGALLIAAGIILFLIAMDSIREQYEPGDKPVATVNGDISVRRLAFRLAFPFVVSPYGVAVVILVLTSRPEFVPITPILAMLGGIMLLNLLAMLGANRIASSPYVAPAFAVVGAVLGVLQAALGIQAILVGLRFAGVVDAT